MKKHTISIPANVADFFHDLENAECGMAYRLLIEYLTTGRMPSLEGRPSAVKLAMKYAAEKLRRRIARRFPQAADIEAASDGIENMAQTARRDPDAVQCGETTPCREIGPDRETVPDGEARSLKDVPEEHIRIMQKVVKLAGKVCSTRKLRHDRIVSQLHERFPGLYRHIIYNDNGEVVLIPA